MIYLAESGSGQIVGSAHLSGCTKLQKETFYEDEAKHRIGQEDAEVIDGYADLYAWHLKAATRFRNLGEGSARPFGATPVRCSGSFPEAMAPSHPSRGAICNGGLCRSCLMGIPRSTD